MSRRAIIGPGAAAGEVAETGIALAAVAEPAVVSSGDGIHFTAELSYDLPNARLTSGWKRYHRITPAMAMLMIAEASPLATA